MTDERLARQLHAADVPEAADPVFVETLYAELATELGFVARALVGPAVPTQRRHLRTVRLLLAAALLLSLVVGVVAVGAALLRPPPDDLLHQVRDAGRLRVALTRGYPQVVMPGGAVEGFEVDIAREIGARLGLETELVMRNGVASMGASSAWDLALTSTLAADPDAPATVVADEIAWWPIAIVVRQDTPLARPDDLAGSRVGMTPGSSAERWLSDGDAAASGSLVAPPPPDLVLIETSSDVACLDALVAGEIQACVATDLVPADLAARPQLRELAGSLPVDVHGAVLRSSGPDPESLAVELRRILGDLRADGTLRDLSLRRFGSDVTVPPGE